MSFVINNNILEKYTEEEGITQAVIPDSVTYIDDEAFAGCENLKEIILPDTVKHIGEAAFIDCFSLESLRIPEKCTYLGDDSFAGCYSLKEILIPDKCRLAPYILDDALGFSRGLPEEECLKVKIRYKGEVYNYETYYDVAPFDENGEYIGESC